MKINYFFTNFYLFIHFFLQRVFAYPVYFLAFVWICVQIYTFLSFGVKLSVDSPMYLDDAKGILNGIFPQNRNLFYCSYSLFIALILSLGGSYFHIAIIQYFIAGFACILLYKTSFILFKRTQISFFTVLFYISWPVIHQWNSFLYTESLFTSFLILCVYLISKPSKNYFYYFLLLVSVLFTIFIRPNGVGLLFSIGVYFLNQLINTNKVSKLYVITLVFIFSAVFILWGQFMLIDYVSSFINSYNSSELIYPSISLGVKPCIDCYYPSASFSPIIRLFLYCIHNPIHFAKITFLKFFLFTSGIKPYFSIFHNLSVIMYLYPLYYCAIIGYAKLKHNSIRLFISSFIIFQVFIISFTSENWDGRFLIPLLPYVFIFSASGFYYFVLKMKEYIMNKNKS